jgi:curli biogenesis system outer membrane secretion channel CsgG
MKKIFLIALTLLLALPLIGAAQSKIRVAVMEFENNAASQWSSWGLGKAAQDAMVTALVESGMFSVIERQKLEMILNEQGLGQSGAVTPQSAAKIGKLLGVQILITGSVTEFGKEETGGGILGVVGANVETYRTALDARMLNTTTGEILAVAKGEGSAVGGAIAIKNVNFGTRGGYNERAGKVMREAVEDIVDQFVEKAEGLKSTLVSTAKIALVKDGKVYINAGSSMDVKVGDVFEVIRLGEAIIDPDTGLELDRETDVVGEIQVTEVKDKVSICKILSGDAQKEDTVRKK